MEILLTLLVGILFGAINFGFLCLGYYIRSKKTDENAVKVDKENAKALSDIYNWVNFSGNKK